MVRPETRNCFSGQRGHYRRPERRLSMRYLSLALLLGFVLAFVAGCESSAPPPEKPAAETPAAETPAAEKPAAEKPAAETPAAEKPAAETPAAK